MADLQTILVIDDDPDWTELLKTYFLDKYRVRVANSPDEAIEIARKDRPVLVILDLVMPVMDGFGVIRRLQDVNQSHIPAILLTGWKSAEVEECADSCGFFAVLGKPVSLSALDAVISEAIKPEARISL
ncbi:MAG TPA: response regulator [Blastocatellia bacterium]|nr:response regulator [Blastocatellia bacterium]